MARKSLIGEWMGAVMAALPPATKNASGRGGREPNDSLWLRIRGGAPLAPLDEDKQCKQQQERAHGKAGNRVRGGI